MTNHECLSQPEEREVIRVRLGEPFSLPPVNLDFIEEDYPELAVVQSFSLEIEGIGKGEVRIMKDKSVFGGLLLPMRTPAGPVTPLLVEVVIADLPENKLDTVRCFLIFDGQSFEGIHGYDEIELTQEGKTKRLFDTWVDPQTQEECSLYFPHNAEVFKRMKFMIKKITSRG